MYWISILATLILAASTQSIVQLDSVNFKKHLASSEWFMVYFYSTTCGFCKQFSPEYNKLAQQMKDKLVFGKLDLPAFPEFGTRYRITHFPELQLFHGGVDLPISYNGQRKVEDLKKWIQEQIDYRVPQADQKVDQSTIVFSGPEDSIEYKVVKVLALRNKLKKFRRQEGVAGQLPSISLRNWKTSQINDNTEKEIRRVTAQLYEFGEEPWMNIFQRKMDGMVFVNQQFDNATLEYIRQVARKNPEIMFTHIENDNSEFYEVLKFFGIVDEPCLMATKPSKGLTYRLPPPLSTQKIDQFLKTFYDQTGRRYNKTERSIHPNMLTLENSHLIQEIPKDVLIFLYNEDQQLTLKFLDLAEYMIEYLKNNPNIHVFVCNLSRNDLILEVAMEPLPKIVYLRHRQKRDPIEYPYKSISAHGIISFIKQNTVFDWPQQMPEL